MIIVFHSITGGAGRTLLALATALTLARSGSRVAVIDTDFEAPSIYLYSRSPEDALRKLENREARDFFTLLLWGLGPGREDLFKVGYDGLEVDALLTYPSLETIDMVTFSWGTNIKYRSVFVHRTEAIAEDLKNMGYDNVIIDARSGLAVPSQDLIAVADAVVEVIGRATSIELKRVVDTFPLLYKGIRERRIQPKRVPQSLLPVLNMVPQEALKTITGGLDEQINNTIAELRNRINGQASAVQIIGPITLPWIQELALPGQRSPRPRDLLQIAVERLEKNINDMLKMILKR